MLESAYFFSLKFAGTSGNIAIVMFFVGILVVFVVVLVLTSYLLSLLFVVLHTGASITPLVLFRIGLQNNLLELPVLFLWLAWWISAHVSARAVFCPVLVRLVPLMVQVTTLYWLLVFVIDLCLVLPSEVIVITRSALTFGGLPFFPSSDVFGPLGMVFGYLHVFVPVEHMVAVLVLTLYMLSMLLMVLHTGASPSSRSHCFRLGSQNILLVLPVPLFLLAWWVSAMVWIIAVFCPVLVWLYLVSDLAQVAIFLWLLGLMEGFLSLWWALRGVHHRPLLPPPFLGLSLGHRCPACHCLAVGGRVTNPQRLLGPALWRPAFLASLAYWVNTCLATFVLFLHLVSRVQRWGTALPTPSLWPPLRPRLHRLSLLFVTTVRRWGAALTTPLVLAFNQVFPGAAQVWRRHCRWALRVLLHAQLLSWAPRLLLLPLLLFCLVLLLPAALPRCRSPVCFCLLIAGTCTAPAPDLS